MALLTAEKLYEFATADKQWFRSLLFYFEQTKKPPANASGFSV